MMINAVKSLYACVGLATLLACTATTPATVIDVSPEGEMAGPRTSYYNLRVGDLRLAFTGNAVMRWTDNLGYSANNNSAWSLVPSLGVDAYYPISPYFQISGGLTAGYEFYLSGDGEDQFFINGSEGALRGDVTAEIRFDDDSAIQISDSFAREIDTLDIAARDRAEDYAAWVHTFSARYSKALNRRTTGKVQYTHNDRWTSDSTFNHLDYSSDSLDAVVLYRLMKNFSLGPYLRVNSTRFHEDKRNDRVIYEGGVSTTGQLQLGGNVSYTFNFGYQSPQISNDNDPTATDEENGLVTNFNLSVRPGVLPGHRFRAGYNRNHTDPDPGVNYSDELFLGYGIDIRLWKEFLASADIDWRDISDSDGGEDATLWRFTLRSTYDLTEKTALRAQYTYTDKSSDVGANEFSQNMIEIGVSHRF